MEIIAGLTRQRCLVRPLVDQFVLKVPLSVAIHLCAVCTPFIKNGIRFHPVGLYVQQIGEPPCARPYLRSVALCTVFALEMSVEVNGQRVSCRLCNDIDDSPHGIGAI